MSGSSMMIWTAWNNGRHHASGAGYGFRINADDRDQHFDRRWRTVSVELPTSMGPVTVEANTAKRSFWEGACRELINREIGQWLRESGYAPWRGNRPPTFRVEGLGRGRFRVAARVDR